ncbi:unnamed protein product [Lota lota]
MGVRGEKRNSRSETDEHYGLTATERWNECSTAFHGGMASGSFPDVTLPSARFCTVAPEEVVVVVMEEVVLEEVVLEMVEVVVVMVVVMEVVMEEVEMEEVEMEEVEMAVVMEEEVVVVLLVFMRQECRT